MDDWQVRPEGSFNRKQSTEKPDLEKLLGNQDRADKFCQTVVIPALERLAVSFHRCGRETSLVTGHHVAGMILIHGGVEEFQYIFSLRVTPDAIIASPSTVVIDPKTSRRIETRRALREGSQG